MINIDRSSGQRPRARSVRSAPKKCACSTRSGGRPPRASCPRSRCRRSPTRPWTASPSSGAELEAGRREFRVVVDIPAGTLRVATQVGPGEAARIMTGAPLPPGVDTVVQVEHTTVDDDVMTVETARRREPTCAAPARTSPPETSSSRRGALLGAAEVGLLAAVGIERVRVARRPRVAILATGSELVSAGQAAPARADPQLQLVHRLRPGGRRRRRPYPSRHRPRRPGRDAAPHGRGAGERRRRSRRAASRSATTTSSSRCRTSSAWSGASGASPPSRASRSPSASAATPWCSACRATRSPPW